jgi:hypothetical protein
MANSKMASRIGARKSSKGSGRAFANEAIPAPSSKSERDYEAEEAARTIARANVIKNDPDLRRRAGKAAVKMAEEKRLELRGLNGIARGARS